METNTNFLSFIQNHNKHFKKLDIDKMIIYLKNQKIKFLSLFDGSMGSYYFHLRLKGLNEGNDYHIDEMIFYVLQKLHLVLNN